MLFASFHRSFNSCWLKIGADKPAAKLYTREAGAVNQNGMNEYVVALTFTPEGTEKFAEATSKMGGVSLITADHGNADRMLEDDGVTPYTAHTTNQVPFYIVGAEGKLRDGKLADIAPTMLDLMGLEKPAEMDGQTLIVTQ